MSGISKHLFTFLVIFSGKNLSWHAEAGELKRLGAGKGGHFREGRGGGGVGCRDLEYCRIELSSY